MNIILTYLFNFDDPGKYYPLILTSFNDQGNYYPSLIIPLLAQVSDIPCVIKFAVIYPCFFETLFIIFIMVSYSANTYGKYFGYF